MKFQIAVTPESELERELLKTFMEWSMFDETTFKKFDERGYLLLETKTPSPTTSVFEFESLFISLGLCFPGRFPQLNKVIQQRRAYDSYRSDNIGSDEASGTTIQSEMEHTSEDSL